MRCEVPNADENVYRMKLNEVPKILTTNKAMFSALVKLRMKDFCVVRKKDCCVVLAGNQQKCRDRAPLSFDNG